jgi:hypothetical protein
LLGRLGLCVSALIATYCKLAVTVPLVRRPWETPWSPDSPASYVFDADELVSAIGESVRTAPEYEAFRDLVMSDLALREFFRLRSERYLTFEAQVFNQANAIARFYFHLIRFRESPQFIGDRANHVALLIEAELLSGEVDTVALALLGGMAAAATYDLEDSVTIRPPTRHEAESFYNGWSIYAVPDLVTRAQILQSDAVLQVKKRMPRNQADQFIGPGYTDYVLAVNLGVGDCYVIQKRFMVESPVTGRAQQVVGATQKFILHPAIINDAAMERIRDYVELIRGGINRGRLSVAINRLTDGVTRPRPSDAFVDYMVGIESIVTSNERGEINFKVALRLAALIGFDRDDALFLLRDIKRLYGVRSRILHGDDVATVESEVQSVRLLLTRAIVMVLRMDYRFEPVLIDRALLKYLYADVPRNRPLLQVLGDLFFRVLRVTLDAIVASAPRGTGTRFGRRTKMDDNRSD